jgi:hypothetical protein
LFEFSGKESAYSEAEQLLWSGLLIFQMYETLQGVESLYFNDWIPPSADRTDKLKRHCGFGPNDVGFKSKRPATIIILG